MHMADALISPSVGGTFWVVSGSLIAAAAGRLKRTLDDHWAPMMGVLGAFVFAAQMINFSIPGTGSSGHLGGGLLLTILLGPWAAFLVMASILTVQALFFADGGLLALGCNVFNLGFFPAFVAFPLVYRPLVKGQVRGRRVWAASVLAAVVGLELGALAVVIETQASGLTELPFKTFALLMMPIHLAIGIVEGVVTAAVVTWVAGARPELVAATARPISASGSRTFACKLLGLALIVGAVVSWFASTHPDGLEWSLARLLGTEEVEREGTEAHKILAEVQEKTAILPDYGFRTGSTEEREPLAEQPAVAHWPAVSLGTSVSGVLGGLLTLGIVALIGWAVRRKPPPTAPRDGSPAAPGGWVA